MSAPGVVTQREWGGHAAELAQWTLNRLVHRTDAWGAYRPENEAGKEYTRQDGSKGVLGPQKTVWGSLTRGVLVRHFRATERSAIIGCHSADAHNQCKAGALDIDWHGPTSTAPDVNLCAALCWYDVLVRQGFHPLLAESNGCGGYHLRVLLTEPIPAERVFAFLRRLTANHQQLGLDKPPEQFPKQSDVRRCAKGLGNWLRLPGRHHKYAFWSRAFDGRHWLADEQAIDFILQLQGDPPSLIPPAAPQTLHPQRIRRAAPAAGRERNLAARINAYMVHLPNLGEGQGRDDIAFRFAAFLVRDLGLADDVALQWLSLWDGGNRPPKGRDRLSEIIANAHSYGQNAVGCDRLASMPQLLPGSRPGHKTLRCVVEME